MVDWQQKLGQLQRLTIAPEQLYNQQISLSTEQQHYLGRVLRLGKGDCFIAMNGLGDWWLAQLQVQQGQAQVLKQISVQTELPISVTLIAALPKGNGFDQVVHQATELGVTRIVPLLSDRTLVVPSPHKVERWRRIAQEAAEQSERQVIPQVLAPLPFQAGLSQGTSGDCGLASYLCVTRYSAPHLLHCLQHPPSGIQIAIGPEGGWTEAEIAQAISIGYQPVSLGRRILRSLSAPLVALSLVTAALEFAQGEG